MRFSRLMTPRANEVSANPGTRIFSDGRLPSPIGPSLPCFARQAFVVASSLRLEISAQCRHHNNDLIFIHARCVRPRVIPFAATGATPTAHTWPAKIAPVDQMDLTGPGIRIYANGFGCWCEVGPGGPIIRWIQWMVL
jgi:hypothetical protein